VGEAHPTLGIITVGWGFGKRDLTVGFWGDCFDAFVVVVDVRAGIGSGLVH